MHDLASIARLSGMLGALPCPWCVEAQSTTVNVQILAGGIYQLYGLPLLENLFPHDTRVQVVSNGLPLSAPDTWDFTELNAMLSPIQNTGDHSPEL